MKTRLLIVAIICLVIFVVLVPIETSVIPQLRVQVVDVNGIPCANMRVTQSWGHYRLYIDGNYSTEIRFTDLNGYVQFPEGMIRASLSRRIIMPIITRITTVMHGGWGVHGVVSTDRLTGALSYESGRSMPEKMRVDKCMSQSLNGS